MPEADAFEEHRPALLGLAYRMLGSYADAEDVVQEAYLRWSRADRSAVESPRAYLHAVVTRLCIDQRRAAEARRESYVGPWLPEPIVGPLPGAADRAEMAESLSMAFLVLLESLSPVERAAFLLRKVFDFDYAEIGRILEKTEPNCRQMVSRAEQHLQERRPRFEAQPGEEERLAGQFLHACTTGDLNGLVSLLAEDAVMYSDGGGKVVSALLPIYGADKIARFFLGVQKKLPPDLEVRSATVNGRPGFVIYSGGQPYSVLAFDVVGGRIAQVFQVPNPDKLTRISDHCPNPT